MSLLTIPKTIFNSSIKLARTPVDVAIGALVGSESGAKNLVDRAEAGARSATGVLFRDEELREQGRAALLATKERERAMTLREQAEVEKREASERQAELSKAPGEAAAEARRKAEQNRRKAEKRRRDREARAAEKEKEKKQKAKKSAAKVKRSNAKAQKT